MGGLLRAELVKTTSTRLWWGLLVPVTLLSILINVFGGLFTAAVPAEMGRMPLLIGSLAFALGYTTVFSLVFGIVIAAGEYRYRTITTTYLTAPRRWPVLLAKTAAAGGVGMVYALVTVVVGVLAGLAGEAGVAFPSAGSLLAVTLIGMAVSGLWGVLGAALGTATANQVGALVGSLVYLMVGELLLTVLLGSSDSYDLQRVVAFLPGKAGSVAIYDLPARVLAGAENSRNLVEIVALVTAPPPWWGALLVLAAWTGAAVATAWVVAGRRDVT
jgi:ABC-2 type transport system permease protein